MEKGIQFLRYLWGVLLALLRNVPLLSGLPDCRRIDHIDALKEFAVNFLFSTVPIWLGGLIIFAIDKGSSKSGATLIETVMGTVKSGELFMYSTAMVAPILYMALKPEKGARTFPGQMSHVVGMAIIALISGAFFGIERAGVVTDAKFTLTISVILYFVSLILLYLAMVYRNYRLTGAPDAGREQEKIFVQEFNRRHPQ